MKDQILAFEKDPLCTTGLGEVKVAVQRAIEEGLAKGRFQRTEKECLKVINFEAVRRRLIGVTQGV